MPCLHLHKLLQFLNRYQNRSRQSTAQCIANRNNGNYFRLVGRFYNYSISINLSVLAYNANIKARLSKFGFKNDGVFSGFNLFHFTGLGKQLNKLRLKTGLAVTYPAFGPVIAPALFFLLYSAVFFSRYSFSVSNLPTAILS